MVLATAVQADHAISSFIAITPRKIAVWMEPDNTSDWLGISAQTGLLDIHKCENMCSPSYCTCGISDTKANDAKHVRNIYNKHGSHSNAKGFFYYIEYDWKNLRARESMSIYIFPFRLNSWCDMRHSTCEAAWQQQLPQIEVSVKGHEWYERGEWQWSLSQTLLID